jgi:hypothetical protein
VDEARCLAALENRVPDAFTIEVAFKRPTLLPARVELLEDSGPARFGVRNARDHKSHLDGMLAPAER